MVRAHLLSCVLAIATASSAAAQTMPHTDGTPPMLQANAACAAIARAVVERIGAGAQVTGCDAPDVPGAWTAAVPDSAARVGEPSWFTLTGVRITTRVKARVDVNAPHAAALQTLTRGRVVAASDIVVSSGSIAGARFDRTADAAGLAGARVTRVIAAGSVIQALDVAMPLLVKPGEPVVAVVRIGAVEVTAAVTAVDGGSIGDQIRVSSKERNRVFRGTVVGPGRVEVIHER